MKVLVFTSLYPNNIWPYHGVFTKERLAPLLPREGFEVKVVAPVPYFPPVRMGRRHMFSQVKRTETIEGVEVYHPRYFMTPKIGMASYGLMMFLGALPLVSRIHRSFDFDVIDAQFVYPDGFAGMLLGRYFRKPVVITSHGTDINLYKDFPVIRSLLRYTLGKADRVIAVCQALKDAMIVLGASGDQISVIPNGIDPSKFYPLPKADARARLGLPNEKLILSVGALIPRKGVDFVIKALKILRDELHQNDVRLLVVGEGNSRMELERLVSALGLQDRVRFIGSVPHRDLYLWYSAADVFCLASNREGWPCVILESLACGTPVVATAVWGVPEVICSDSVGLLTKRSERDIAEKLLAALTTRWNVDVMTEYARGYTWDRAAHAALGAFEAAMAPIPAS